jgi:transcriptional regulator with XRE-family HTH domain
MNDLGQHLSLQKCNFLYSEQEMSNFGAKLAETLEQNKLSQAELSRLTDISEALISKWMNGQQTFVSTEDLGKLCVHITSKPKERAELVRAHLYDEMPDKGAELLNVSISGTISYLKETAPARAPLPLNLQRAFKILQREALHDADVRAVILGLTKIVAPETREE